MMRAATEQPTVICRLPTFRVAWALVVAALPLVASAIADAATSQPDYEVRTLHDPDGTGKFYMGREIAHVMGPGGIAWLERPERELEERPTQAIAALELKPGQT